MTEYKIIIIEPEDCFRESLRLLMDYSFEFNVARALKNVAGDTLAKAGMPDIILTGIEKKKELEMLVRQFPGVPVVVITSDENDDHMVELLSAGAAHYIFKGSEPAFYLSILKEVLTNNIKIPDSVVKKLIRSQKPGALPGSSIPGLTSRENELLGLLAKGYTYRAISEKLFISMETVKRHCHNIYKKLEVKNRTEAINKVVLKK